MKSFFAFMCFLLGAAVALANPASTATLLNGSTLTFTLLNGQVIAGPNYLYEVWIKSSDGTSRMGDIQVYNNYNTTAFGPSIVTNLKVSVTKNSAAFGGTYTQNASNNNTSSRFGYSWTYSGGAGNGVIIPSSGDGVLAFTVQIDIADQGAMAGITFEQSLMDGQAYHDDNSSATKWTTSATGGLDTPLPVTLLSFTAALAPAQGGVMLNWKTVSEVNNYGFEVQKALETPDKFESIPNAFIPGHGTTLAPQQYSYVDVQARPGKWYYRLKQIDLDGALHYSEAVSVTMALTGVAEVAPQVFQLLQNYPNPFNPETNIKFSVKSTDRATVEIYNAVGQRVATLFDAVAEAGVYHTVKFGGQGLASGVYFYRLQSGKQTDLKKLLLLK